MSSADTQIFKLRILNVHLLHFSNTSVSYKQLIREVTVWGVVIVGVTDLEKQHTQSPAGRKEGEGQERPSKRGAVLHART